MGRLVATRAVLLLCAAALLLGSVAARDEFDYFLLVR
jgi:hypothetical protein